MLVDVLVELDVVEVVEVLVDEVLVLVLVLVEVVAHSKMRSSTT